MSVSSISTGSPATASQLSPRSGQNPTFKDFRQLAQAIKSGDLSAAQSAFSTLSDQLDASDQSSASTTANNSSDASTNPFKQLLQQIGSALDNNDIQGAQQALSSFDQQVKGKGGHHHHGGGGNVQASATATSATAGPQDASNAFVTVGINLQV